MQRGRLPDEVEKRKEKEARRVHKLQAISILPSRFPHSASCRSLARTASVSEKYYETAKRTGELPELRSQLPITEPYEVRESVR